MLAQLETRGLLIQGIVDSAGSPTKGADKLGISVSMLSRIRNLERRLPDDLKLKACEMSLKSALAIIKEATGYHKLFSFFTKDRHPANLYQKVKKEDREADTAYEDIADRLIDKPEDSDLTDDDIPFIQGRTCEIAHRMKADMNYLVGLAERYPSLKLEKLFTEKENICREDR